MAAPILGTHDSRRGRPHRACGLCAQQSREARICDVPGSLAFLDLAPAGRQRRHDWLARHGGYRAAQPTLRRPQPRRVGPSKAIPTTSSPLSQRAPRQLQIAPNIPHHRVQLRDQDSQHFAHMEHLEGCDGKVRCNDKAPYRRRVG